MKKAFRSIWRIASAPIRVLGRIFHQIIKLIQYPTNKVRLFFTDTSQSTSSSLVDAFGTVVEHPSSLSSHLEVVRKHIIRSAIAVILFSIFSFYFIKPIMQFLTDPLPGGFESLIAIDITENIGAVMKVTLLCGFTIAVPYLALEAYLFYAPALKPSTRIINLLVIPLALFLFLGGMAFAFYIMLPIALPFLFDFMGLTTQPRPSSYFGFITAILFWLGLFFEFPLITSLLAWIGVIRAETLKSQWRIAVIIMAILAATITPTVDPINMGLVMGPMIILYLISILFSRLAQKLRQHSN